MLLWFYVREKALGKNSKIHGKNVLFMVYFRQYIRQKVAVNRQQAEDNEWGVFRNPDNTKQKPGNLIYYNCFYTFTSN
jgi:hypothetical protein